MDAQPLRLSVAAVDQIFNAPDINPFSTRETDTLGVSGVEWLIQRLQLRPAADDGGETLVVVLPPDQITPELSGQLAAALQRYCTARRDDNRLEIRLSRRQHTFGLLLVTAISLLAIALAFILVMSIFAEADQVVQGLIVGSTSVFVWVIMWDPLEALLFDWAMPARENRVLERIIKMKVVVEAQG